MDILIPSLYCQVFVFWRERGGNMDLGCSARKFECNCCTHRRNYLLEISMLGVKRRHLGRRKILLFVIVPACHLIQRSTLFILVTCTLLNVHCKDSALSTSTELIYPCIGNTFLSKLYVQNTFMVFQIPITVVIKLNAINVILTVYMMECPSKFT